MNVLVLLDHFSCEYSLTENPTYENLSVLEDQPLCRGRGRLRDLLSLMKEASISSPVQVLRQRVVFTKSILF